MAKFYIGIILTKLDQFGNAYQFPSSIPFPEYIRVSTVSIQCHKISTITECGNIQIGNYFVPTAGITVPHSKRTKYDTDEYYVVLGSKSSTHDDVVKFDNGFECKNAEYMVSKFNEIIAKYCGVKNVSDIGYALSNITDDNMIFYRVAQQNIQQYNSI